MDKGGKTQVEVAKMLGISQGRVSQINKLNNQPEAIQNAVKNGQLAGTAVIEFDAATDDVQANILELLKDNPDIKITAEQIKNLRLEAQEIAQRESEAGDDADADSYDPINPADPTEEEDEASGADQEEAAPESAPARTKVVGRTIKHVKEFMEGKQGPLDNANGKKLAKMINDFIAGTKSAEQLERCWNKIFPDVESS
jgi:predicted transcriptional regulator